MSKISWSCKRFEQLSPAELYSILRLRNEVFVVEQNCPYVDTDNKDQQSWHLCGIQDGELAAYARLIPPGIAYKEASIGRVVSSPSKRGTGAGKELMEQAVSHCHRLFGVFPIRIGAQLYLHRFYTGLGFEQVSDTYLEDGIPHVEMIHSK